MTLDTPTKERLKLLYPDFAQHVVNVYSYIFDTYGLTMRCMQGLRTYEEQDQAYAIGRTEPGKIITNAKGGYGYHNFGLAADSCFLGNDPFLVKHSLRDKIWGDFGNKCVFETMVWGGNFDIKDLDHCEMSYTFRLSELRSLYEEGGLGLVFNDIDQRRTNAN